MRTAQSEVFPACQHTPRGYNERMPMLQKMSAQDKVSKQLHRVAGQIEGISRMYEEGRPCIDIAQQLAAVRSSLSRVARDILTDELSRCSRERDCQRLDKVLKELLRY